MATSVELDFFEMHPNSIMLALLTTQAYIYPGVEMLSKLIDLGANILAITKYFAHYVQKKVHRELRKKVKKKIVKLK